MGNILSNTENLTPTTIMELFVFFSIIELLGIFFSWLKERNK